MFSTRRTFLKTSAAATALATVPRPLLASLGGRPEPLPPIQDARIKELTLRGVDAARSQGADYADVRLTHTRWRFISRAGVVERETMEVGVRALLDGYWGFASGPIWSLDEMARLGREAVHQARVNSLGVPRSVVLAPTPVVRDGHWTMPVKIDPFEVSPVEIMDFLVGLGNFAERQPYYAGYYTSQCEFLMQSKAFGSTTGSYCTQQLYRMEGKYSLTLQKNGVAGGAGVDTLTPAGMGWELFTHQPLRELLRQAIDQALADMALPLKPVDVGRYDIVLDVGSMPSLLSSTIGAATELDRALGYEANAGGTSYLNDPLEMLGAFKVGNSLLNVSANRSEPGGVATVQWDDEGVAPQPFQLIDKGVLVNFQTMREGGGWLQDWYSKRKIPLRSNGCAYAPTAIEAPLPHTANLVMAPGSESLDFDTLVANSSKGIAFRGIDFFTDFQQLNGIGTNGQAFEIKDGKRVARIAGASIMFRTPELWKNIIASGGPESVRRFGLFSRKGEPPQSSYHSVTAVPVAIKDATIIDAMRKA
jgi:TldD protein